jgi:hypothetical protein
MVEYQVGDTIFELLNNSSEKFSRAQAWILPTDTVIQSTRLSVKSSELGPLTRMGMFLPPFGSKGETHSRAGEEVRRSNSDEGTDNLVLYVIVQYTIIPLRFYPQRSWARNKYYSITDHSPEIFFAVETVSPPSYLMR